MAGNPVYGVGYHDGSRDGHQEGLEEGLAIGVGIGAAGLAVLGGAAYGVKKGVDKLKDLAAARHQKKLLAMEDPEVPQLDEENDEEDNAQNQ